MKTKFYSVLTGLTLCLQIILPSVLQGQTKNAFIQKYLTKLPGFSVSNTPQMYRMTAVYTNRDLYGNFTGKIKVTGDYTRGLERGQVKWNDIYISHSDNFVEPFPAGAKQDYMEDMQYIPSPEMLDAIAFKDFPGSTETVFSKNLVWDMMALEGFAWDYTDSLRLNKIFRIPEAAAPFNMADIGSYAHTEIQLCWTGISAVAEELCAIVEFRAPDNKISLSVNGLKSKGTEQYWGTIWISLNTRMIESAAMYGGTIQEIEVPGVPNKFLVKTIRELWVEKIQ